MDLISFQFENDNRKVDILIKMRDQTPSYDKLVPREYSETSFWRTSFIADKSLQGTLFSGTDEMTVKLSQENLHVADTL